MGKDNNKIIASLDINAEALVQSMEAAKKKIDELAEKKQKLIDKGKESSKKFQEVEQALVKLESAYRLQEKTIAANIENTRKMLTQKQQLTVATEQLNSTENDYIANNEELIRIKKELNIKSDDYGKQLATINAKLLENNNWLQENGSAYTRVVTTMDDYKQRTIDSFNSINVLNGGLSGLISRSQEAGGAGQLLTGALTGMGSGIAGMTRSAMAFIATPFGLVLAAIAAVFALVQNSMDRGTESAGKITKVFSVFSLITDRLMEMLEPLGDFLIDGIAMGFDLAGKAAEAAIGFIADSLSLLGFDEAAEGVNNFTEDIKKTVTETGNLKKAQEELAAQMTVQEEQNEVAKNQMDDLIKKSENHKLSEQARRKALQEAAAIEKKNFEERAALAQKAYENTVNQIAITRRLTAEEKACLEEGGAEYAKKLMKVKGITQQELDTLQKANTEKIKLNGEEQAMARSQNDAMLKLESDFQAKRDAERERKRQADKKRIDDAITLQKLELDYLLESQGVKAKTLQEELDLAQKVAAAKTKIAQDEYNASDKSAIAKKQHQIEDARIANELAEAQKNVAVANAEQALNDYIANSKSFIEQDKFASDTIIALEKDRYDKMAQEQIKFNLVRLRQGEIDQQEFNAQEARIQAETNATKQKLDEQGTEAKKAKDAIDLQNKMAADTANMDYSLTFQQGQLAAMEKQELDAAEKSGADVSHIKAKYAKLNADAEKQVMDNKLALASSTFGNLATIMGKESAAGKAMAVAQATIDTYKSAVSAYGAMATIPVVGPALGAVAAAAAVAAGVANVKKITATKAPKAEKGALFNIGGNRHSAGGTMFQGADGTTFEAEQGELIGVMNRNAARHFMAFNNAFPAGGASVPNYFAGGGIVSREIASPTLNTDELAAKIATANAAIPAPVVAVQDIILQGNSYVKVRDGANF